MTETRTWNAERAGYDVIGTCWECRHPVSYFVDEDGTPREVTPVEPQPTHEHGVRPPGACPVCGHPLVLDGDPPWPCPFPGCRCGHPKEAAP